VGKTIVHREAKTFTHRSAALSWARHREVELENPAALTPKQHGTVTLAQLIRWYIDAFATISNWRRTKQTHLEFLERHSIGRANALTLTSRMLIDHVRSRRADGAGPATVINDLVWIGVVLRAAKNVKELPVRPEITQEASGACRELRLIGKPRRRVRRPTGDKLARLREYFVGRDRRAQIPMQAIVNFAMASARREAEICWGSPRSSKSRLGMSLMPALDIGFEQRPEMVSKTLRHFDHRVHFLATGRRNLRALI